MNNSRSKLLVDIANSRNKILCVSEAQDLIDYIDEANEETRVCTKKDISMDLEDRPLKVSNDERQVAEAHSDGEQNHTSADILSQSDLNYIIDTVGEISNDGIDLNMPICENETPQPIPENDNNEESLVSTPMPSPCMTFGDTVNECNCLSESSVILSDETLRSSPLGSSEMSGSSTPHQRKKKRQYVKKAITRNRITNKSNWLDEKRKVLVNLGEAHKSRSGKQQMAKQIKGPCPSTCRLKCFEKFDVVARQNIFKTFWNLGDHSRQWSFIASHVKEIRKKQWTQDSKRLNVYKFFLPLLSGIGIKEKIMVCKSMFKNTFSISNTFIQSAIDKHDKNMGMRGFHQNHPTIINATMKENVIQHVKCFAPIESHYTRKDSNKQYLDSELTFKKMYDLYTVWCKELNITENIATSVRQYKDIINKELNIAFHLPKKDQCDLCHAMKNNTSPTNDDKLKHKSHMDNKKLARELKHVDKIEAHSNPSDICTAMFDFQKINNTPHGEISVLYYKRKLSVYNFTIFDAGLKEATCYMWDETVAKRGANEVSSCLFSFINNKVKAGVKDFRFWSDNCAGQNRNQIVFFMYLYVSNTFKVDVCHRFLEKGHTQNEADSVHALIERSSKNKLIYTPDEWYTLVRWAKQNSPPYTVVEVNQDLVLDFKAWLHTKNWIKDTNLEKISWNMIREVKVQRNNSDIIEFKGRKKKEKGVILEKVYNNPIPITEVKYRDLISLCDTMIIPKKYHTFYNNLKHSKEEQGNDEEDC
ncbi:uncharacterized protein LOC120630653 [Pararge aegeria]|uniref:uncharacterized protein LOC120630653 n=1 Tax=Pararge aegeria TaxID=116150 RepID=UPI0019D15A40|nr:uncharacterized protein LOC120630653 [Pararge aegeria]